MCLCQHSIFQIDVLATYTLIRYWLLAICYWLYRKPIHQQFLKEFTGDYRFSRQFDDQAAVTIVAILHQELFGIPNVPILWHERTHNLTLKIAHHGRTDHMKGERVPSAKKGTNLFKMIKDDWAGLETRCGAYFES